MLSSFGCKRQAESLLNRGLVKVQPNGHIHLFSENSNREYLDLRPSVNSQVNYWLTDAPERIDRPFAIRKGSSDRLKVFLSPFAAFKSKQFDLFSLEPQKDSALVLMKPDADILKAFLRRNPHFKAIDFVSATPNCIPRSEKDLFKHIRSRDYSKERDFKWLYHEHEERGKGKVILDHELGFDL